MICTTFSGQSFHTPGRGGGQGHVPIAAISMYYSLITPLYGVKAGTSKNLTSSNKDVKKKQSLTGTSDGGVQFLQFCSQSLDFHNFLCKISKISVSCALHKLLHIC